MHDGLSGNVWMEEITEEEYISWLKICQLVNSPCGIVMAKLLACFPLFTALMYPRSTSDFSFMFLLQKETKGKKVWKSKVWGKRMNLESPQFLSFSKKKGNELFVSVSNRCSTETGSSGFFVFVLPLQWNVNSTSAKQTTQTEKCSFLSQRSFNVEPDHPVRDSANKNYFSTTTLD